MIRSPLPRALGGLALVAAAAVYLVTEAITAAAWTHPRYSYAENYVSDLGVTGPRSSSVSVSEVSDAGISLSDIVATC